MTHQQFVNYMYEKPWRLRIFTVFYAIPFVGGLGVFAILIDILSGCETLRGGMQAYAWAMRELFRQVRTGRE